MPRILLGVHVWGPISVLVHVYKCICIYLYSCVPIGPSLTVCVIYPCFVWVGLLACSQMCLCMQKCLDACGRQSYQLITQAETLSQKGHTACQELDPGSLCLSSDYPHS